MKKMMALLFLLSSWTGFAAEQSTLGQEKSTSCAACHGPTGVSPNAMWPNLAGQHATYIKKQLRDFKLAKLRHADLMVPFVATLSEQDMTDLAQFYSKQPLVVSGLKSSNARGEQLYRVGDANKQITACIACHGPRGSGNEEAGFPSLAGQQATYTIQQLQAFKKGTRQNDLSEIMQTISGRMSLDDMTAVANYLSVLH